MDWIKDYWYVIVFVLVAAMFLFGFRIKDKTGADFHEDHKHGTHDGEKGHGKHRGCCH